MLFELFIVCCCFVILTTIHTNRQIDGHLEGIKGTTITITKKDRNIKQFLHIIFWLYFDSFFI